MGGRVALRSGAQRTLPPTNREDVMAKGQMRPPKEKKKPKADHNQKKKGGPAPSAFATSPSPGQPGSAFGKKT
jgi:hypothetical protein